MEGLGGWVVGWCECVCTVCDLNAGENSPQATCLASCFPRLSTLDSTCAHTHTHTHTPPRWIGVRLVARYCASDSLRWSDGTEAVTHPASPSSYRSLPTRNPTSKIHTLQPICSPSLVLGSRDAHGIYLPSTVCNEPLPALRERCAGEASMQYTVWTARSPPLLHLQNTIPSSRP